MAMTQARTTTEGWEQGIDGLNMAGGVRASTPCPLPRRRGTGSLKALALTLAVAGWATWAPASSEPAAAPSAGHPEAPQPVQEHVIPVVPSLDGALKPEELKERWGIEIVATRLVAHGAMVDVRYRVLNPAKVPPLASREEKPTLLNQTTGRRLHVPRTPKVGGLRQTTQMLETGRVYFMLFGNSRGQVRKGDKVALEIGGMRARDLVVE